MYSPQRIEEVSAPAASTPHVIADHPEWTLGAMVGRSPVMQRLFSQMRTTSRHLRIATVEGESGAGKALAAQTLHDLGPVSAAPLVPCPAVQFFQHGPSLVPLMPVMRDARGGTLFLTHVEELSLEQQARLLALLQWLDHQHARHTVDSIPRQLFFSSNHPLRKLSASPAFRADLCHRLTAIRFAIPPLRDRRDDVALLADYFAQRFSATHGKPVRGLAPLTLPRLSSHLWPGNVRELQSVIHSAALEREGQWIRPIDVPVLSPTPLSQTFVSVPAEDDPNLDRAILRHINVVLARVAGNKLRAARMLGISRSTLYRLLETGSSNSTSASAPGASSYPLPPASSTLR